MSATERHEYLVWIDIDPQAESETEALERFESELRELVNRTAESVPGSTVSFE